MDDLTSRFGSFFKSDFLVLISFAVLAYQPPYFLFCLEPQGRNVEQCQVSCSMRSGVNGEEEWRKEEGVGRQNRRRRRNPSPSIVTLPPSSTCNAYVGL